MNKFIWIFMAGVFGVFLSCGDGPASHQHSVAPDSLTIPPVTSMDSQETGTSLPVEPTCEIEGIVLEGNRFWSREENLIVVIAATRETSGPNGEESHRSLLIYDGKTCEPVFTKILPVDQSPDFPYRLSDITYNNLSKVIAIKGSTHLLILDLISRKLSGPMMPRFLNERFAEDASSGLIQRLELWEDYLIGFASGKGTFIFDLSNPLEATAVLPAAEFALTEGMDYHSMFFLRSNDQENGYQAILPSSNPETGDFMVQPLFDKPVDLETNLNRNFRNNRFIVLKESVNGQIQPVGIDMKEMKKIRIPAEIAAKKDTDIIAWMKRQ